MNLSEPFIRKPVMTTLCALSAAVFGIAAYFFLPVSDLPDVAYPVISVTTNYPGASPQIVANNISTPLEIQMMQIEGLNLITSRNQEGTSSIVLQFALGKDMGRAEAEVEAAIQRAMGNLPNDLPAPPSFQTTNPNTQPIAYITMASDTLTLGDLYDYANNMVAQRMMMLEGVSSASVYGSPRSVNIKIDANALTSRGLTLTDVQSAVQTGNVFIPGGQIYGNTLQYIIDPKGSCCTPRTTTTSSSVTRTAPRFGCATWRDRSTACKASTWTSISGRAGRSNARRSSAWVSHPRRERTMSRLPQLSARPSPSSSPRCRSRSIRTSTTTAPCRSSRASTT